MLRRGPESSASSGRLQGPNGAFDAAPQTRRTVPPPANDNVRPVLQRVPLPLLTALAAAAVLLWLYAAALP